MRDEVQIVVLGAPGGRVDALRAAGEARVESVSIVAVDSVEAAVNALEAHPDLTGVVTEYVLDDRAVEDGVEVVETIREGSEAPVAVFTADGSELVASRATVAGATAYVPTTAPDGPERVLDAVVDGLNAGRSRASRNHEKIETLHDVATDLEAYESEEEVFEGAIEAAEQVLEFDQCMLDVRRGDELVPVGTSSGLPEGGAQRVPIDAENVASRVARTREATINDDLSEVTDADPADMAFRSGFTVPVSDVGVFQAVAEETAAFDEDDLELAQLLAAHVAESLKRVRSRQQLKEERDRFAALFENVPDPAVRARLDDEAEGPIVERVNGAFAETFGCDPDAVVGNPLASVVVAPDGEADDGVFAAVDGGVEVVDREVQREAVDGTRDFILHVIPIDGGEREVYGIYTDITATKERERALERQNERLDEFASVVSHDLRNPLNLAEGHLVNYEETGDEESLEEVGYAHERMRSLIEDLLDLARSGAVVSDVEAVDLGEAAHRAWGSLHAPNAELVVAETDYVLADTGRLVDVFANLFRNSIEHGVDATDAGTDGGPADDQYVTISVGPLADEPGFFVADDGPGIPESEREAVFETGYTNAEDGSGFGLSIVDQIARAHGWTVTVTAGADGGARFEFRDVELAS